MFDVIELRCAGIHYCPPLDRLTHEPTSHPPRNRLPVGAPTADATETYLNTHSDIRLEQILRAPAISDSHPPRDSDHDTEILSHRGLPALNCENHVRELRTFFTVVLEPNIHTFSVLSETLQDFLKSKLCYTQANSLLNTELRSLNRT